MVESNNSPNQGCENPDCQVSSTGVCAEGHVPVESCPTYGRAQVPEPGHGDKIESADHSPLSQTQSLPLPDGKLLSAEDVDTFLRCKPAKIISVVGERSSGKTTLVCALYDSFLRGSFAGYWFAGSQTLYGFEEKIHYARVASGGVTPDTLRTSWADGLKFFHLGVVENERPGQRSDIMLSERAGEYYARARDQLEFVGELVEVAQAHRVLLLLDGERIADPFRRAEAIFSVRQMVRAFLQGGALSSKSSVHIVTTKFDLIESHVDKDSIGEELNTFRENLVADFESDLGAITFWSVAARDPEGQLKPGHGLENLFKNWFEDVKYTKNQSLPDLSGASEFDRLLLRNDEGLVE